jgi:D-glycero-alpha-D-manno-heptose-7-phosphate kinase
MIVTRAPVRFSLGGGGTDLPSYAREHGGFVVAAAVDKHVRVSVTRHASSDLAYRSSGAVERAAHVGLLRHPLLRECLRVSGVTSGVEVRIDADVPAGSGLGSSGAFTVALLDALHAYRGKILTREKLARLACHVEIDRLRQPVGKQDQYIATYGGIRAFTFHRDGRVSVERLRMSPSRIDDFVSRIVVLWSGVTRRASGILEAQQQNILEPGAAAVEKMHRIKALGHDTLRLLDRGTFDEYGELLHEHWTAKREVASTISDPTLDEHYEAARRAGAIGGKLMGAGGGGFFMFYVRPALRSAFVETMAKRMLRELPFAIDHGGARARICGDDVAARSPLRQSA